MQLILQKCLSKELIARQKFFYETFHLWLIVSSSNNSYIQLGSIPTNSLDILFIVGHNVFVNDFLQHNQIKEERIVAITCDGTIHLSSFKLSGKIIYLSHQNEANYADLLKGELYGFGFDPTESELLLCNANKSVDPVQRLEMSFCKL